jgi:hypothetical protein
MSKPLLISDCDEVLLHMVAPFRDWVDEAHDIHFDFESGDFVGALRHKYDGTTIEPAKIWPLLTGFFDTEMHRQKAIDGAVAAINRLSEVADVVILTNLMEDRAGPRAEQLRAVGVDFPVYCNQGGKGAKMASIIAEYEPSVTVFVDDLGHQHKDIAELLPHVWRLHLVGEPLLAPNIKPTRAAHARIDDWGDAEHWIRDKLLGGVHAPILEKPILEEEAT